MSHKQQMLDYMAKVKEAMDEITEINELIQREVTRRYGRRIDEALKPAERKNLRRFYTVQVTKENIWHAKAKGDRDLYIALATMHGIAEQADPGGSV